MATTSTPILTLTADELSDLVSSVNNDTLTWSTGNWSPGYGAVPTTGVGTGTDLVYTTSNTAPVYTIGASSGTYQPTVNVQAGTGLELQGENADIKINGKSMKAWMVAVEQRLNILTPNPELEADWNDLRRLGERYRKLEKKCQEKARMWQELQKIQPRQL